MLLLTGSHTGAAPVLGRVALARDKSGGVATVINQHFRTAALSTEWLKLGFGISLVPSERVQGPVRHDAISPWPAALRRPCHVLGNCTLFRASGGPAVVKARLAGAARAA